MLSITKSEKYPCCSSENIVKNGFTKEGNQRVLCHDCLKSLVLHRKFSHDFDFEAVRRSFLERMSLCGVSQVFLISYYRKGEPSSVQRIEPHRRSDCIFY